MNLDPLIDEALARCDALGRISDDPPRLTRLFLSPATRRAQALVSGWMRDAGLLVRRDAIGNLIGRHDGSGPKVFLVGSHIDTVPNAGKYDGVLGVMLGIAAAKALRDQPLVRSLDVVAFSEEEGARFRMPYLGSRVAAGRFTRDLLDLSDAGGITLAKSIRDFGLDPDEFPAAVYPAELLAGYFEVHIEQGPVLESLDRPLGIVDSIVGQSRFQFTFTGQAGHAGTQPMDLRKDALAAAAEFVTAVERHARSSPGVRATVGQLSVNPGATNVVPGEVRLSLDVRHTRDAERNAAVATLLNGARQIAADRELAFAVEPIAEQPAVPMDTALTNRLAAHCPGAHLMVSGAGHDAAIMAGVCPAAMLFIRSPGGISHHPDESVRRDDVRAALETIIAFLDRELHSSE